MTEDHPFGVSAPSNTEYLILGSFTGKRSEEDIANGYDWFYGTKRNQFWPILEETFGFELKTKKAKQALFKKLGIAITDIVLSCERKKNSNLDMNLTNIVFNTDALTKLLKKHQIKRIFFSSRSVEGLFRKNFKHLIVDYPKIELITLPSPSPRYAAMTRAEKVRKYREILPKLK
jgi:double-stranded uracil-DNA glycosylase